MNDVDKIDPATLRLLGKALAPDATQEVIAEVEALLESKPAALRVYVQMCLLESQLMINERVKLATASALRQIDISTEDARWGSSARVLRRSRFSVTVGWSSIMSGRALGFALAVFTGTALVWLGMMGLLAFQSPSVPRHDNAIAVIVKPAARIVAHADATWLNGDTPPGPELGEGEKLEIQQGIVEIEFLSGAHVVIEGPATFVTTSQKEGFLREGRLTARVSHQARGFSVATPVTTVVDLGTEFGLIVAPDGITEVHVFSGLVEATTTNGNADVLASAPDGHAYLLQEGEAALFRPGEAPNEFYAARRHEFRRPTLVVPTSSAPADLPDPDSIPQPILPGLVGSDLTDPLEAGHPNCTVTGGGDGNPREGYPQVFDNDVNTKWFANNDSRGNFLIFGFADGKAHVVRSFTVTSANDRPARDPYCWWLSGSQDGKKFTRLYGYMVQRYATTSDGESPWKRFETRAFTVPNNETAYAYYRFDFCTAAGTGVSLSTEEFGPDGIQIAEIELFDVNVLEKSEKK